MNLRPSCGDQVQPVLSKPCYEENRLNRLNSQAQSVPVIADGQAKPYPSRVVRLFSTQTKCEESAAPRGPAVTPQAWSGLASLRAMGSFKKLRSSVLQGIQNRSNAMAAGQERNHSPVLNGDTNGFLVTKRNVTTNDRTLEFDKVSNGTSQSSKASLLDEDEDCEVEEEGFQRNSHFSRSIRRAYGAGRIPLVDIAQRQPEHPSTSEPIAEKSAVPCEVLEAQENVKVQSRLSKSADNLHVFKSPFRRKLTSTEPQNPESTDTTILQRTTSSSSVDLQNGSSKHPMRPRGHLRKLVGSLTDLSVKSRNSQGPASKVPQSPLSQLHDDYSRRTPCVASTGRQRRPSPAPSKDQHGTQVNINQHMPTLHSAPSCPAFFSSVLDDSLEPPSKTTALMSDCTHVVESSTDFSTVCSLESYCEPMECHQNGAHDHVSQMLARCSSPSQKDTVNSNNTEVRYCIISHHPHMLLTSVNNNMLNMHSVAFMDWLMIPYYSLKAIRRGRNECENLFVSSPDDIVILFVLNQ